MPQTGHIPTPCLRKIGIAFLPRAHFTALVILAHPTHLPPPFPFACDSRIRSPLDGDLLGVCSLGHLPTGASTFYNLGVTWPLGHCYLCVLDVVLAVRGRETVVQGCVSICMCIFCFKLKPCSSAQQLTAAPNDGWPGTEPEPWLRSRPGVGQTCLAWWLLSLV